MIITVLLAGTNPIAIVAGAVHTCAALLGNGMVCWGFNSNGQLGIGSTTEAHTPTVVKSGWTSKDLSFFYIVFA